MNAVMVDPMVTSRMTPPPIHRVWRRIEIGCEIWWRSSKNKWFLDIYVRAGYLASMLTFSKALKLFWWLVFLFQHLGFCLDVREWQTWKWKKESESESEREDAGLLTHIYKEIKRAKLSDNSCSKNQSCTTLHQHASIKPEESKVYQLVVWPDVSANRTGHFC